MTVADLAKTRLYLAHARFRGARALPNDNEDLARKFLRELGRPATVETQEQLDALPRWSVIQDGDGFVCQRWEEGWYAVKSTRLHQPALGPDPVIVYSAGEES